MNCYPVRGKQKSIDLCSAFAQGCQRGRVLHEWRPGDSFFYGINDSNQECWSQALLTQKQHHFYYADNAYFDATRGSHFRITRDRLQHRGTGISDGKRFAALGIDIKPWRASGRHIVVCPQSDDFMRRVVGYSGDWLEDVRQQLALRTERPLRIRGWSRNKAELAATLHDDLRDAWALVTWSSAAAIEAILAGIPAVVMGQCAAFPVSIRLDDLENDVLACVRADRHDWAAVLADNQWTLDEIRAGVAWRALVA